MCIVQTALSFDSFARLRVSLAQNWRISEPVQRITAYRANEFITDYRFSLRRDNEVIELVLPDSDATRQFIRDDELRLVEMLGAKIAS